MVKDSDKDLRIRERIESIKGYIEYLNEEVEMLSQSINEYLDQNSQQEQSYTKENIFQYVEKALLDDKIDFNKEDIRHSNYDEQEELKNLRNRRREYVKATSAYKTYYIMCEDGSCLWAYEKKSHYDPNDNTCYSLENIFGEILCTFYDLESYSKNLGQPVSVIEINGNKALCLKAASFYPYDYISILMRTRIEFSLNRLIKGNPNLVSDIIADILSSQPSQDQMQLLKNN